MRGVWGWATLLIGAALIAIVVIVTSFPPPRDQDEAAPAGAQTASGVAAIAALPDDAAAAAAAPVASVREPAIGAGEAIPGFPAPGPFAPRGPAVGVGAPIPGRDLPTPIEPEVGLRAELAAYVDNIRSQLPRLEGNISLDGVSLVGNQLHFITTIQIDLADYVYAYDPEFLGPQLLGWSCDGSMCFAFTDKYARDPCRSDVADLIARGAVAVYVYRDAQGRFMGQMAVTDGDCERLADR